MAKKDRTPKEQLAAYRKEIGKQYMDGLISDKEYESLLYTKEAELGLADSAITMPKEDPECPACGALVNPKDTECMICGSVLEPVLDETQAAEALPAPVIQEKVCPSCGAAASYMDTICVVCGGNLRDILDSTVPEIPAEEKVCPSCGAIVEPNATECPICETPFEVVEKIEAETPMAVAVAAPIPVPKKSKAREVPPSEEPKPEPAEPERVCPSCGAVVEPDATECPICETPFEVVEKIEAETPMAVAVAAPVPVPKESEAREVPPPEEPKQPEQQEIVCAGCGAVLDEGADECFICGAKLGEEPTGIPAAAPEMPPAEGEPEPATPEPEIPPEEVHMAATPPQAEILCAGCGAVLDEGADECFICGAKLGEEPTGIPAAAPEMPPAEGEPEPAPPEPEIPHVEEEPEIPPGEIPEQPAEEIKLADNEILCPSCSSVIQADSEKCPECWTDLSLYVKCPSCGKLTPAGEETCRECFATIGLAEIGKAIDEELGLEGPGITEEIEITEELKVEMTTLENEEEQGKECLVCGAIFGPEDQLCPICGIQYGVVIEEPEIPETTWEHMDMELLPTIHTCPSCGENVTGLEATEREVKESHWFYRGLVAIFIGIFFTSFSIYARGISVENESLGMQPPPTDVVLNLVGWILVLIGFMFWFMSWRLHGQRIECPHCGIETDPGMAVCINCGEQLIEEEEPAPGEEEVDEELLPEQPEQMPQEVYPDILPDEALQDVPPEDAPQDFGAPKIPPETETVPDVPQTPEEPVAENEELEVPAEPAEAKPEHFEHGEDIPVEHEEHKKCPGCGIFVELADTVCPICDTPFAPPEPVQPETVKDAEIQVPTEEEELAGLDLAESSQSIDNITVPKESGDQIECPSCGASLEAGTKSCPVCEYPVGQ